MPADTSEQEIARGLAYARAELEKAEEQCRVLLPLWADALARVTIYRTMADGFLALGTKHVELLREVDALNEPAQALDGRPSLI